MNEFKEIIIESFGESLEIIGIIFILMVLIEIFVLKYKHLLLRLAETNSFFAYIVSSFFGSIPNCTATFAMDSLYMTGYLSFGGLVAAMIASVDDVGIYLFSFAIDGKISLLIVSVFVLSLFLLGIIGGKLADVLAKKFKWSFNIKCDIVKHDKEEFKLKHFIHEHIFKHIIKKHIWKIFIWMFLTLVVLGMFPDIFSPESFRSFNMIYLLVIAALIGLLPIPAPNLLFIIMFSQGLIPFSVLLTNSIVQDGHGLLPILGYSFRDAMKVKLFKLVFGLLIGVLIFYLGF
jgi:hypothetical protein